MSETLFFDFLALDAPLDESLAASLRALARRAEVGPDRLTVELAFGELAADPGQLLESYFDAYLHLAGEDSRELILKLPLGALRLEGAHRYLEDELNAAWETETHLLLAFGSEELARPAEEPRGWLPRLAPLRDNLISGDPRLLYLGWLLQIERGELIDDAAEPLLPAGLTELDDSLEAFAELFEISDSLLIAAAELSPPLCDEDSGAARSDWLASLPDDAKQALLLRVMRGEGAVVERELRLAFSQQGGANAWPLLDTGRTAGDLRAAAKRAPRTRPQPSEPAPEQIEQQAAVLVQLSAPSAPAPRDETDEGHAPDWGAIERAIGERKATGYLRAAELLRELQRQFAERGEPADYPQRLRQLCKTHARKQRLMEALDEAGVQR